MISGAPEPLGPEAFDALVNSLLAANWNDPDGPLRLNSSLQPADLEGSAFFQNTRIFLTELAETGGAPATATGNLNRAFVTGILEKLCLSKVRRESIVQYCKALSELEVWDLHLVRIVSECAGLVARRKKHFKLTTAGRELLPDHQAGHLFRKLFLTYFRKFDLHYDFYLRDVPGIQQTMAVILWRLDTIARDWTPVRGVAPKILLRHVLLQLHSAMNFPHDTEEWILAGYVLEPLLDLGLIERRVRSQWPSIDARDHFRVSPLWRKFISFKISSSAFVGN